MQKGDRRKRRRERGSADQRSLWAVMWDEDDQLSCSLRPLDDTKHDYTVVLLFIRIACNFNYLALQLTHKVSQSSVSVDLALGIPQLLAKCVLHLLHTSACSSLVPRTPLS